LYVCVFIVTGIDTSPLGHLTGQVIFVVKVISRVTLFVVHYYFYPLTKPGHLTQHAEAAILPTVILFAPCAKLPAALGKLSRFEILLPLFFDGLVHDISSLRGAGI
jgi:hypothetical protein